MPLGFYQTLMSSRVSPATYSRTTSSIHLIRPNPLGALGQETIVWRLAGWLHRYIFDFFIIINCLPMSNHPFGRPSSVICILKSTGRKMCL